MAAPQARKKPTGPAESLRERVSALYTIGRLPSYGCTRGGRLCHAGARAARHAWGTAECRRLSGPVGLEPLAGVFDLRLDAREVRAAQGAHHLLPVESALERRRHW